MPENAKKQPDLWTDCLFWPKYASIFAMRMDKSCLRAAMKPLGGPFSLENAVFLLKKHEIAAFVLIDKSGYFYV